jgi:hypothetical protein
LDGANHQISTANIPAGVYFVEAHMPSNRLGRTKLVVIK